MRNPYGEYKKNQVLTATKEQVLIMLYEAAIRNCKAAERAMNLKKIADKGTHLLKVQDIVNELLVTLDEKADPALVDKLKGLYLFMLDKITEANINNSVESIKTVQQLLETLHEGWKGAVESLKNEKTK